MTVVLLTGATGLLGKVVLEELLRIHEAAHVLLIIRGNAHERFQRLASLPCFDGLPADWRRRVRVLSGDLTQPGCGLDDAERLAVVNSVTHVIHCAASVEFTLPVLEAAHANVTTSLEVLALARECRKLRAMVSVSTAYVSPHREGPVEESMVALSGGAEAMYRAILEGLGDGLPAISGHPNTYTLTKCIGEHLLRERRGGLPLTLLRPSIIAACRRYPFPGWIDRPTALAGFVALYATGQLLSLRADPNTLLDVVPCDEVVSRILHCTFEPPGEGFAIRHAVAGSTNSVRISDCAAAAEQYFGGRRLTYVSEEDTPACPRLRSLHDNFAYFTRHSFDFRSSLPLDVGFDAERYLQTVCEGVQRHLMGERAGIRSQKQEQKTTR